MLSSAQPVTGMAPAMFVVPSMGVSNTPKGLVLGPIAAVTFTMGELLKFGDVRMTIPETIPLTGKLEVTMLMVNDPFPVPDVGDTIMKF